MNHGKCIISGYVAGERFRPSNWSERLCEAGATLDPVKRVLRYSKHLYPRYCTQHGNSVHVDFDALESNVASYISWFIQNNGLEVFSLEQPIDLQSMIKQPEAAGNTRVKGFKRDKAA